MTIAGEQNLVHVNMQLVPEPGVVGLLAIGGLALLRRRRAAA
jgi:hypothetical protein